MSKSEKIYNKLSKIYTDEEIVESFVFNDDSLSDEEQQRADEEFKALRMERLKNMTAEEIQFGKLVQLKLKINDYLAENKFHESYTFGRQLKQYVKIISRTNKEFAADIGIHPTKLSRIINGKERPNVDLMYRLEEHSNGKIPAHRWWRVHSMELEHQIRTDTNKKAVAAEKVSNRIGV
jgi:plasmid maintenance system antidote protein VapI